MPCYYELLAYRVSYCVVCRSLRHGVILGSTLQETRKNSSVPSSSSSATGSEEPSELLTWRIDSERHKNTASKQGYDDVEWKCYDVERLAGYWSLLEKYSLFYNERITTNNKNYDVAS